MAGRVVRAATAPVFEWDLLSARVRASIVDGVEQRLKWYRDEIPSDVLQHVHRDDLQQYFAGARWIENDAVRRKVDEIARRSRLRFTPPVRPREYDPTEHRVGGPAEPTIPPTLAERLHLTEPQTAAAEPEPDPEPADWDESVPDPLSIEPDDEQEPAAEEAPPPDPLAQIDELEGIGTPTGEAVPGEESPQDSSDAEPPTEPEPAADDTLTDPTEGSGVVEIEPPPPLEEDPSEAPGNPSPTDPVAELDALVTEIETKLAARSSVGSIDETEPVGTDSDEPAPMETFEEMPADAATAPEPTPEIRVLNPREQDVYPPFPDTIWASIFMGGIVVMLLACWNLAAPYTAGMPTIPFVSIGWAFAGLLMICIGVAIFAATSLGEPSERVVYDYAPNVARAQSSPRVIIEHADRVELIEPR